jgi:M6 family metalloprotease-like protein
MRHLHLATVLLIAATLCVHALQPPAPGEMERYRADGTYAARVRDAQVFGNHLVKPCLAQRTAAKLRALTGQPALLAPPPAWQGMPTTGTNKVLILCIAFRDITNSVSYGTVTNMVFGAGSAGNYPRESLQRYYTRASYGNLLLDGSVLGWYVCTNNRSFYKPDGAAYDNYANYLIIKEALDYYDAQGHDFSQYDNDGDGNVDYFAVFWTGPIGAWATFWWGYQWSLYSANLTKDGVRFYDFSWQWEASSPYVLIHETGHALGVPDYYDYDSSVGPRGGVGGLDMMDGNKGDHNAFSKFMLEWLTPTIVTTNLTAFPQRASSLYRDAVLIAPTVTNTGQMFSEYFMAQNRYRTLNDTNMPGSGFLIWHVDARLSGGGFVYNNSYTDHKLLRLMEADGLEQIEQGTAGNAGDYYTQGKTFGPATTPNSSRYDGSRTYATVSAFSANAMNMTANVGFTRPIIGVLNTTLVFSAAGGNPESQAVVVTNRGDAPLDVAVQVLGNYTYLDSGAPGGPPFAWIDIAASGSAVSPLSDDGTAGPYALGFAFPFAGSVYNQCYVSMNGGITFANVALGADNTALPAANPATAFIAANWDDHNPAAGGTIRYASVSGSFVVAFLNIPRYGDTASTNTFQIVLQTNGAVILQYKSTTGVGNAATVGVQGNGGLSAPALQVAYNTAYIKPDLAVRIAAQSLLPGWLSCAPTLATVSAGAALPILFTANPAGLTSGIYTHTVSMTHSDVDQPPQSIAVTLAVPEPGALMLLGSLCLLRRRPQSEISNLKFQISNDH